MLSVEMPSGYAFEQFEGLRIIRDGPVPELKEVDTTRPGQTIWYLDHVSKDIRCFEHTVRHLFVYLEFVHFYSAHIYYSIIRTHQLL